MFAPGPDMVVACAEIAIAQSSLTQTAAKRFVTTFGLFVVHRAKCRAKHSSRRAFAYGLRNQHTRLRLNAHEFPAVGKTIV
jgi:hypothetical protein